MKHRHALTPAEAAFVQQQRVARLATTDEDGIAYLVPFCYAFDGTYFYTPLDEKPKSVPVTQLRRVRNILANQHATLLVDQYDDDWSRLGYVQVQARAELLAPADPRHAHALILLRARYVQYLTMVLENAPVILLTPQHVNSWGPALLLAQQQLEDI